MDKDRETIATVILIIAIIIGSSIIIVSLSDKDTNQIETDDFTTTVPWSESDIQVIKTGNGAYEIHDKVNNTLLGGITVADSSSPEEWKQTNQRIFDRMGGVFLHEEDIGDVYQAPTDKGVFYAVCKYDSYKNKGITVMCDKSGEAKMIMKNIYLK